MASIGDQGFDFVDVPKMVLVSKGHIRNVLQMRRAVQRFTRFWMTFVSQLAVAMDNVVTAPLQFSGD